MNSVLVWPVPASEAQHVRPDLVAFERRVKYVSTVAQASRVYYTSVADQMCLNALVVTVCVAISCSSVLA